MKKNRISVRVRTKALLMALLFLLTLFQVPLIAWAEERAMATRVNEEGLVYSVSNPSNGKIQFYIRVPAGETVSYSVDLIPNNRTDSIDTKTGSYTNSGTTEVTRKITVTAKYFSNKYTIYASYTTGPSANRTIHEDTDSATSALKTPVSSEMFIWTQDLIDTYRTAGFVIRTLTFSVAGYVSFKLSGAAVAAAVETILQIANDAAETFVKKEGSIVTTPKVNCGYKIVLEPYNGGYTQKLIEYNEARIVVQEVPLGSVSLSTITIGVR